MSGESGRVAEVDQSESGMEPDSASSEVCPSCRGFGVWGHYDCERCLGTGRLASDDELPRNAA